MFQIVLCFLLAFSAVRTGYSCTVTSENVSQSALKNMKQSLQEAFVLVHDMAKKVQSNKNMLWMVDNCRNNLAGRQNHHKCNITTPTLHCNVLTAEKLNHVLSDLHREHSRSRTGELALYMHNFALCSVNIRERMRKHLSNYPNGSIASAVYTHISYGQMMKLVGLLESATIYGNVASNCIKYHVDPVTSGQKDALSNQEYIWFVTGADNMFTHLSEIDEYHEIALRKSTNCQHELVAVLADMMKTFSK